jgi:hypothetical protein
MKPGKQDGRGQPLRLAPQPAVRSGAVVRLDFGRPPADRLTPAEVAELRQMIEEFRAIKRACPIAKRALGLD